MIDNIIKLIRDYKISDAFWAAAESVDQDSSKQQLLLSILSINNNVALLYADGALDKIQKMAERGHPYMQYALARIHDTLAISPDSDAIKTKYYNLALEKGIADACFYLALMNLDGSFGEIDEIAAEDLIQKGIDMNSALALCYKLRIKIFGSDHTKPNPEFAYRAAEKYVTEVDFPCPVFYLLMGHAATQLGRKDDAISNYRIAAENGCAPGFFWWATAECSDEIFTVTDKARYMEIMEKGMAVRSAECYVMCPMLFDENDFAKLNEDEQKSYHATLSADLEMGWLLGNSTCALYLAMYHEQGLFGFEKNMAQAWMWYARGALLRCGFCFGAMARMILTDKTAPEKYDPETGYEYAYRGLLNSNSGMLEYVIQGYMSGYLTHHANMIERKWLPEYERIKFSANNN